MNFIMQSLRVIDSLTIEFVDAWRAFVRKPTFASIPITIDTLTLLCHHGRLIYDLNIDNSRNGDISYLTSKEWDIICQKYQLNGVTVVIQKAVLAGGDSILFSEKDTCQECRLNRLLDYTEGLITISKERQNQITDESTDKEVNQQPTDFRNDGASYEIEKVVAHKQEGGQSLFLVRWTGFDSVDDTWEPIECFDNIDTINKFMDAKKDANGVLIEEPQISNVSTDNQINESLLAPLHSMKPEENDDDVILLSEVRQKPAASKKSSRPKSGETLELSSDDDDIQFTGTSSRKHNTPINVEDSHIKKSSKRQRLNSSDGFKLETKKKIMKQCVSDDSEVLVKAKSSSRRAKTVNLEFKIKSTTTLRELSLTVMDRFFVPSIYQKLSLEGLILDKPDATMRELNIYPGVTLKLEAFDQNLKKFDFSGTFIFIIGLPTARERGFEGTNLLGRHFESDDFTESLIGTVMAKSGSHPDNTSNSIVLMDTPMKLRPSDVAMSCSSVEEICDNFSNSPTPCQKVVHDPLETPILQI